MIAVCTSGHSTSTSNDFCPTCGEDITSGESRSAPSPPTTGSARAHGQPSAAGASPGSATDSLSSNNRGAIIAASVVVLLLAIVGIGIVADGDDDPVATSTSTSPTPISSDVTTPSPSRAGGSGGQQNTNNGSGGGQGTVMPDLIGDNLQGAQDKLQSLGSYFLDQEDASGQGRIQILDSGWVVCRQKPLPGQPLRPSTLVVLSSVKIGEQC